MHCPCGSDRFDQRLDVRREVGAVRWLPASRDSHTALGSAPLGASMGAGTARWGRVELTLVTGALAVHCLNCERLRREKPVGGGMALGSWWQDGALFVAMSDVADPACATVRFQSAGHTAEAGVEVVDVLVPALPAPNGTAATLPPGAVVADVVFRVAVPASVYAYPEVTFEVTLVDKCLSFAQPLTTYIPPDLPEPPPDVPVLVSEVISLYARWYFGPTFLDAWRTPANYAAVDAAIKALQGTAATASAQNVQAAHGGDSLKPLFIGAVRLPYNPGNATPSDVIFVEEFATQRISTYSDGTVETVNTSPRNAVATGQVFGDVLIEHDAPYVPPPVLTKWTPADPTSWGQWRLSLPGPVPQFGGQSGLGDELSGRTARNFLFTCTEADSLIDPTMVVPHPAIYTIAMGGLSGNKNRQANVLEYADGFRSSNPAFTFVFRAKIYSFAKYNNLLGDHHPSGIGAGATVYFFVQPDRRIGMTQYQYNAIVYEPQPARRVAPTLTWPSDGAWHVASFRYDPVTQLVRFGVDQTFETIATPVAMLATGSTNLQLRAIAGYGFDLGGYPEPDAAIADLGAWQRYLSDDDLKQKAKWILGL